MILSRTLSAELLKLKNTLALWLTLPIPLVVVFLFFLNYSRPGGENLVLGDNAWLWLTQNVLTLWGLIMFPLFIALEAALIAGIDHNAHAWKQLFALSTPRWSIILAKLLVVMGLVVIGMVSLFIWIFIAGIGINFFNPNIGFEVAFPVGPITYLLGMTLISSPLIIVIQLWVALRWRSFVVTISIAIMAVFVALIVSQTSLWFLFPWAVPGNVENILYQEIVGEPTGLLNQVWLAIGINVTTSVVVAFLSIFSLAKRDVS